MKTIFRTGMKFESTNECGARVVWTLTEIKNSKYHFDLVPDSGAVLVPNPILRRDYLLGKIADGTLRSSTSR